MQRALLNEMQRLLDARIPFAVATVVHAQGSVPGKPGARLLMRADGSVLGTVGGAGLEERAKALCREALADRKSRLVQFDLANWKPQGLNSVCGGTVHLSIEYVHPKPHLLLFGGGHVTKALHDLAQPLEYSVTVVDDRADYAAPGRFPHGTPVHADPAPWVKGADLGRYSHAYVMGYSHEQDVDILDALLARGFTGYLGLIGSRAKKQSFHERLRKRGHPEEAVERIRCPVGIMIGAETPEEIAVSILAEIIQGEKARPGA
ncbi:MAG TPA: XdhC/CoxI family protein [Candidatus Thermoplasmatota archaeon]|nr:XdhC/CoxI family protein [Candidatus Thermoplasmatota archaeon]